MRQNGQSKTEPSLHSGHLTVIGKAGRGGARMSHRVAYPKGDTDEAADVAPRVSVASFW